MNQRKSVVQAERDIMVTAGRETCALPWNSSWSQPWDSDSLEGVWPRPRCVERAWLALMCTCGRGRIRKGRLGFYLGSSPNSQFSHR